MIAIQIIFFGQLYFEGVGIDRLLDVKFDWLTFNRLHFVFFPFYMFIFAANTKKMQVVDFSFFYVPPLIWFGLLFLGGSGANHMIVNPSMVSLISGLYLLRFYLKYFHQNIHKRVYLLWFLILIICSVIHLCLPTFPE